MSFNLFPMGESEASEYIQFYGSEHEGLNQERLPKHLRQRLAKRKLNEISPSDIPEMM